MFFTFTNREMNGLSASIFKINNEALAIACGVSEDHPFFRIGNRANPDCDNMNKTLLRFHALELYLIAFPDYQKILNRFVKDKEHLKEPWRARLKNAEKNPLLQILSILREYSGKKNTLPDDNKFADTTSSEMTVYGASVESDDDVSNPIGKVYFILKIMQISQGSTIRESIDTFWNARRIKQQLQYLDKNDPLQKLVTNLLSVDNEQTSYYPNGYAGSMTLRAPEERFVRFLEKLVSDEMVGEALISIQKGQKSYYESGYGLLNIESYNRHVESYDLFSQGLFAEIIEYQDELAYNCAFICKNGTPDEIQKMLLMARKLGYQKQSMTTDEEYKEVTQLFAERMEKTGKSLQAALAERWKHFKMTSAMPKMKEPEVKKEESIQHFVFTRYPDAKEVSRQFKKLTVLHHPDLGGDAEIFKKIEKERNALLERISSGFRIGGFFPKTATIPETKAAAPLKFLAGSVAEDAAATPTTDEKKSFSSTSVVKYQDDSKNESKKQSPEEKETSAVRSLITVTQSKALTVMAAKDKINKILHDEFIIDRGNISPIPSLILMLQMLDKTYSDNCVNGKSQTSRASLKIMKELYLNHLNEIRLCMEGERCYLSGGKLVTIRASHMNIADMNFVMQSPVLNADSSIAGLFKATESTSIGKAKIILAELKTKSTEHKQQPVFSTKYADIYSEIEARIQRYKNTIKDSESLLGLNDAIQRDMGRPIDHSGHDAAIKKIQEYIAGFVELKTQLDARDKTNKSITDCINAALGTSVRFESLVERDITIYGLFDRLRILDTTPAKVKAETQEVKIDPAPKKETHEIKIPAATTPKASRPTPAAPTTPSVAAPGSPRHFTPIVPAEPKADPAPKPKSKKQTYRTRNTGD